MCYDEAMAIKNFVFRENWVGSKVAGMKTTFLTQPGPTFWTEKAQLMDSLNSILVKTDIVLEMWHC